MSRVVGGRGRLGKLVLMYSVSLCVCCVVSFVCIGPWRGDCSSIVYSEERLAGDIMRFGTKRAYKQGEDGEMYEIEVEIASIERVELKRIKQEGASEPSWLPALSLVKLAHAECDPYYPEEGSVSYTANVTIYRVMADRERVEEVGAVSGIMGTYHGNDSDGPRRYELGERGSVYLKFLPSNSSSLNLYSAGINLNGVEIRYSGVTPEPPEQFRDEEFVNYNHVDMENRD